eukprot:TRINITY_DN13845_c0_g1_i1.p1 TRINITY_DN13845_c0_g1~~TRINITY_DN13845_c0_g1_i1.p1  ORF type:complete len:429 (+),score=73.34 TRINITY_DN13845_c0_g1_i1:471-1757(+)
MERVPCLCKAQNCTKSGPPGYAGLLGEKSIEFLKDPAAFVEKSCEQYKSRVFLTRLFMKQTVVIAEHKLLTQFLGHSHENFYNGLKDFTELFGHNIMFANAEEAAQLKCILLPLFGSNAVESYQTVLNDVLEDWSQNLDINNEINLYEEFKNISLAYNIHIFMGVKKTDDEDFFNSIKELSSTHWHGVTSVPWNFSIPFFGNGGYKKAMGAKKKLLKIIAERLSANSSSFFDEFRNNNQGSISQELLHNHMLLFSCALIPKGVGSVLAMFFELGTKWKHMLNSDGKLSEDDMECIILEVMRMFPPFMGGTKVASKDTSVGEYHVPAGTAVYYSFMAAMRDPSAFLYPEEFMPGRWKKIEDRNKHLGFGTGLHGCIGRHLTWNCIKEIIRYTMDNFIITFPDTYPPEVKLLPVLRPKQPHGFRIARRTK